MLDFIHSEGIDETVLSRAEQLRRDHPVAPEDRHRSPQSRFRYYVKNAQAENPAADLFEP